MENTRPGGSSTELVRFPDLITRTAFFIALLLMVGEYDPIRRPDWPQMPEMSLCAIGGMRGRLYSMMKHALARAQLCAHNTSLFVYFIGLEQIFIFDTF